MEILKRLSDHLERERVVAEAESRMSLRSTWLSEPTLSWAIDKGAHFEHGDDELIIYVSHWSWLKRKVGRWLSTLTKSSIK